MTDLLNDVLKDSEILAEYNIELERRLDRVGVEAIQARQERDRMAANNVALRHDNDRQAMVITEANDELRRLRQTTSQQAARIRVLERRMEAVKGSKFGDMFNEMMKKIEATGGEA